MGLLDRVQVNVFEVVRCPCTDDRITLPHSTVRAMHKLSSVEKHVERAKNKVENLPSNFKIVDLQ